MIKERYVNFEVASLLRDKGFDEPCHATYDTAVTGKPEFSEYAVLNFFPYGMKNSNDKYNMVISAPSQAMACDWIEKKYHYIIDVHLDVESGEASSWVWSVYKRINVEGREPYAILYFEDYEPYEFDNQELAYNEALKYVLTNLV